MDALSMIIRSAMEQGKVPSLVGDYTPDEPVSLQLDTGDKKRLLRLLGRDSEAKALEVKNGFS